LGLWIRPSGSSRGQKKYLSKFIAGQKTVFQFFNNHTHTNKVIINPSMVIRHDRNAESGNPSDRSSIRLFHAPGGSSSWDLIGHSEPTPARAAVAEAAPEPATPGRKHFAPPADAVTDIVAGNMAAEPEVEAAPQFVAAPAPAAPAPTMHDDIVAGNIANRNRNQRSSIFLGENDAAAGNAQPERRQAKPGYHASRESGGGAIPSDDHLVRTGRQQGRQQMQQQQQQPQMMMQQQEVTGAGWDAQSNAAPVTGSRAASRVLQPPGGRSSFTLG
jgi:hypothetical protein